MKSKTRFMRGRARSLIVLTLVWIIGLIVIGLQHFTWLPIVAAVWGALAIGVALAMKSRREGRDNKRGRLLRLRSIFVSAAAFVAVISLSGLSTFVIGAISWDPIGVRNDLGSPPCETIERSSASSRAGDIASVRQTGCAGTRDGVESFFVFVHSPSSSPTRSDLAFRYTPTAKGASSPPKVAWVAPSVLRISVGDGMILQVTAQQTNVHGVDVVYLLGSAVKPSATTWWQRPFGPACC